MYHHDLNGLSSIMFLFHVEIIYFTNCQLDFLSFGHRENNSNRKYSSLNLGPRVTMAFNVSSRKILITCCITSNFLTFIFTWTQIILWSIPLIQMFTTSTLQWRGVIIIGCTAFGEHKDTKLQNCTIVILYELEGTKGSHGKVSLHWLYPQGSDIFPRSLWGQQFSRERDGTYTGALSNLNSLQNTGFS